MDILETLTGIHLVYQISCLSPLLIERKTWTLKESRPLKIYTVIVIITSLTFMLFCLFMERDFVETDNNDLGQSVDFIQMLGIRVAHIASITEGLFRRAEQKEFYKEIKQVDRIFECSLNIDLQNTEFRRTTILLGLLMALLYLAAEFLILFTKLAAHEEIFLLFWFLYLMPLLICSIRYFQMFTCIRLLKRRLDLLVHVLDQMNIKKQIYEEEELDLKEKLSLKLSLDSMETYIFHRRNCDMEHPELKKLLIVREVYNRLFHVNESLNSCFGISTLINVGNDFISITSNCYWIFYNLHDFYATKNQFLLVGNSFLWTLPHLLNIVVIALLCESTVQKTNKIALNLHRINADIWNDNHNTVIEQFSLQLLHQKISISAAGFFNIDCTLLYTIVGATTTYLIILIQFHMSETSHSHGRRP